MQLFNRLFITLGMAFTGFMPLAAHADVLDSVLTLEHRTKAFIERDQYRHPAQTLRFFDVKPDMAVVEISPGAGWYSEILAPLLKDQGKYYAAHFPANSQSPFQQKSLAAFKKKLQNNPAVYSKVQLTEFFPPQFINIAPEASADRVLTFRNVHNWYMAGGDAAVLAAFSAMYKALKPGGILGVVEHRLPASRPVSEQEKSGYMHEEYVVRLAKKAGFEFKEQSIINANPKDTAYHPAGVWTLPPSLRLGEQDREKYIAIGESDRMTLKFVKP